MMEILGKESRPPPGNTSCKAASRCWSGRGVHGNRVKLLELQPQRDAAFSAKKGVKSLWQADARMTQLRMPDWTQDGRRPEIGYFSKNVTNTERMGRARPNKYKTRAFYLRLKQCRPPDRTPILQLQLAGGHGPLGMDITVQ